MERPSVAEIWSVCVKASEMLATSVWVTVLITICAGILGILLGFGLCVLGRAGNRGCSLGTAGFVQIMQSLPALVLFMVLYRSFSDGKNMYGVWIAIACFGSWFAAEMAKVMSDGIDAVGSVQAEAAQALGYTRGKAFLKIIMPQAAKHLFPAFKKELSSLARQVSVVGCMMAVDLTPAVALLYFFMSWLFSFTIGHMRLPKAVRCRIGIGKGVRQP